MTPKNDNPLLDFSGLPRFDDIRPEHVAPAIDALLADARAALERVASDAAPADWDDVVAPCVDARRRSPRPRVGRGEPPERRRRHARAARRLQRRAAEGDRVPHATSAQDERLYAQATRRSPIAAFGDARRGARARRVGTPCAISAVAAPSCRRAAQGALKRGAGRARRSCRAKFDDNVLDATNALGATTSTTRRARRRARRREARGARAAAQADGRDGCKLTLHFPCYLPVMQYARRPRAARADVPRLRRRAPPNSARAEWDNSAADRAHPRAAPRGSAAARLSRLRRGVARAEDGATRRARCSTSCATSRGARARSPSATCAELRDFARDELGIDDIAAWDIAFVEREAEGSERYSFSEQEVKQYFTEDRGARRAVPRRRDALRRARSGPTSAETWHPSVRFFEIVDARAARCVGQFYLDLYARAGKRGGAWMDDAINRRACARPACRRPVAYLTCNFSGAASAASRALFTHDEVTTLFHEFGHGLHQMLTQVDDRGRVGHFRASSGTRSSCPASSWRTSAGNGKCCQHMTRARRDAASRCRARCSTGCSPRKNFQQRPADACARSSSRCSTCGCTRIRRRAAPERRIAGVLDEVRREIAVVPRPAYNRFMHSFAHIFAGRLRGRLLQLQMGRGAVGGRFQPFEETGVLSPEVGARFRDEVLARGGSRPALESFVAFRGREPQIDALLRHNGMVET